MTKLEKYQYCKEENAKAYLTESMGGQVYRVLEFYGIDFGIEDHAFIAIHYGFKPATYHYIKIHYTGNGTYVIINHQRYNLGDFILHNIEVH